MDPTLKLFYYQETVRIQDYEFLIVFSIMDLILPARPLQVVMSPITTLKHLNHIYFSQLTRLRKRFRVGINMEFDEIDDELAEQFDDDEALWSNEVEDEEED